MTSQNMTVLGAFAAMLAFIQVGLPVETSVWIKLVVGAANAGLSTYLGLTNKGTMTVVEKEKK